MKFSSFTLVALLHLLLMCITLSNANNLTRVLSLLRTFQTYACDGNYLSLNCTPRTVISIVFAQYAPTTPTMDSCGTTTKRNNRIANTLNRNETCTAEDIKSLHYAFLSKTEMNCREQNQCKLKLSPSEITPSNGHAVCRETTKFAEVAFKCRPNTFINKIVCENSRLKMNCAASDDRIIVLSAFYGAAPQNSAVPECPSARVFNHQEASCTAPEVTERVISMCQGKKNCTIDANSENLSKPICSAPGVIHRKSYLKVVYTCISKKMLLPEFDSETITSVASNFVNTTLPNTSTISDASSESHITSPSTVSNEPLMGSGTPNEHTNCTTLPDSMQVVGFISDWISAIAFLRKKRELFFWYLLASILGAIVCILATLSARLYYQKRIAQRRSRNMKHQKHQNIRNTVDTFDGLDFDEEENDDADDEHKPEAENCDLNRMESFSNSNTEDPYSRTPLSSRPLIYSTLRKKPATFAQHQVHCPENQLYGYILPQAPPLGCSWSAQQRSSLALASLPSPISPTHYQSLHHHHSHHFQHHQPHPQHYTQAPKSLPPTTPSALPVISGVRTSGMFDFGPLHIARIASTTTTTEISPNSGNIAVLDSPPPPGAGSSSLTNSMMSTGNDSNVPPPLPQPEGTSSLIITKV